MRKDKTTINAKLVRDVAARITAEAERDNRSINNMIETLCLEALDAREAAREERAGTA